MATKQCIKCGITKPLDKFVWRTERNSYYGDCRVCRNIRQMERLRESGKGAEYFQRFKANNPAAYRARYTRANQKYYATPEGKLRSLIGNAVYRSLSGRRKQQPTFVALGYTLAELMTHLERQFTDGMSWDNHGQWHVDHIVPLVSFNIPSMASEDFKAAWSLANLRPIWGAENVRKSGKRTHLL